MNKRGTIMAGLIAAMAAAAIWHGPVGTADRFAEERETIARLNLEYYEMDPQVAVAMQRGPLTRRLWLTGRADDFQRSELVRILDGIPAVADVQWWRPEGGSLRGEPVLPLIVEVELAAIAGFGFGMIVAFLVALRRRATRWNKI